MTCLGAAAKIISTAHFIVQGDSRFTWIALFLNSTSRFHVNKASLVVAPAETKKRLPAAITPGQTEPVSQQRSTRAAGVGFSGGHAGIVIYQGTRLRPQWPQER